MLPVHRRGDSLLREFLAGKLERCDKREKALIRTFLKQVNAFRSAASEGGIDAECVVLSMRRGLKPGSFELYVRAYGSGEIRIAYLPTLVMQGTDALGRIFKEISPHTLTVAHNHVPARDPFESGRTARQTNVETTLIPGRTRP